MTDKVILHTDGACRGNPGPAAAGWVIFDQQGQLVQQGGRALGITTNNVAEYAAAKLGLEACIALGVKQVVLKADSQLLIRQLLGQYQVRNEGLRGYLVAVKQLLQQFDQFSLLHVPRAENQQADAMANAALDSALGK